MSDADSVRSAHTAALSVHASVAETMRQVGARDGRFDDGLITSTARLAVAAWAMAVDGDTTTLAAHSGPDAVHWLLHPVRKPWRVAPGPIVTQIEIWGLDASAEPPRLKASFRFSGRRLADDRAQGAKADGETLFAGLLDLTLGAAGQQPWQLASGHVLTLDEFLGYVFTSRRETPEEQRQRTGPAAARPAGAGRRRAFLIRAGYEDHDVRFGSSVTIEVRQESAPTRHEAVQLVWPAIEEETSRALGEGDWRPSLSWLDVIELRP